MAREEEHGYSMEGVAFGLTDGIICFLGIIIGVAEATQNITLVVISAIIGGIADSLGNSFGFFASQLTERNVQIHNKVDHGEEVRVHSEREVWMSGVLSFGATMLALAILIVPFAVFSLQMAIVSTFMVGTVALFILGLYVGKISDKNPLKTGLEYAALGVVGVVISYLVGDALRHLTRIQV